MLITAMSWNQLEPFCLDLAREIHTGLLQPSEAEGYPRLFHAAYRALRKAPFSAEEKQLLQEQIFTLIQFFREEGCALAQDFAKLDGPYERICQHIFRVGKRLIAERNQQQALPRLNILRDTLPMDWHTCLETYDLPDLTRLPPSCYPVYYIGGAARILARHFMGVENPGGELPAADFDFLVSSEEAAQTLCETFAGQGVDPKGVKVYPDFGDDPNDSFCNGDVSFNQIVLGINILGQPVFYRSTAADRSLDTGIIKPISETLEDFYNIHFYRHPDKPHVHIYSPAILERVHKFVVEGKAAGFYLESHNFNVPMGSRHLVGIRRLLSAPAKKQPLLFWRLASIFEQTEDVSPHAFFDHLDYLLDERYANFHMKPVPPGQDDKAKWFVSLLIRVVMRGVADPYGQVADHYRHAPNQAERHQRMILIDPDSAPGDAFIKRFWEWRANSRFPSPPSD